MVARTKAGRMHGGGRRTDTAEAKGDGWRGGARASGLAGATAAPGGGPGGDIARLRALRHRDRGHGAHAGHGARISRRQPGAARARPGRRGGRSRRRRSRPARRAGRGADPGAGGALGRRHAPARHPGRRGPRPAPGRRHPRRSPAGRAGHRPAALGRRGGGRAPPGHHPRHRRDPEGRQLPARPAQPRSRGGRAAMRADAAPAARRAGDGVGRRHRRRCPLVGCPAGRGA